MRTSIRLGVLASTAALAASLGAGAVAHADVSTTGVSGALSGTTLAITNSTDKPLVCEAIIGEKAVVDVAYK